MREQTTWSGFRTNRSLALFIHFENCLFFARIFWVAPDAFHTHTHAPLAHNSKERKLFIDTWNHKSRQCSACESRDARGRRSTSWVTDNVCVWAGEAQQKPPESMRIPCHVSENSNNANKVEKCGPENICCRSLQNGLSYCLNDMRMDSSVHHNRAER